MQSAELIVLTVLKFVGVFRLSRWLTGGRLRILAYHGVSLIDEHRFRPGLFMTAKTFQSRMQALQEWGYPVLDLSSAVELLKEGRLPTAAVVLTIDDGWYGTYEVMAPILRKFGYPATLYVASYYMERQTPVFEVAVDYAIWRSPLSSVDLKAVGGGMAGRFDMTVQGDRDRLAAHALGAIRSTREPEERRELFRRFCSVLNVGWGEVEQRRVLSFMTAGEARQLQEFGIDLQLHTHRHRFPAADHALIAREIEDNRQALAPLCTGPLVHLCYPSGEYAESAFNILQECGVVTATTTNRGLVTLRDSLLELPRLLDSDSLPLVRFEAELSGFLELVRQCLRAVGRR